MNRRFLSPALLALVLNLILLSCPLQGQITLRDGWALRSAKEVKATGEQVSSVTYSASGWYSNLVKSGFVVLGYDPIGQGERRQYWTRRQTLPRWRGPHL
jgi:hypothetical protein